MAFTVTNGKVLLIAGSTGNDTIKGGSGRDTVDYSGLSTPGIVAFSNLGIVNKGGNNGIDTFTSVEKLIGSSSVDVFYVDSITFVDGGGGFDYLIELSPGVNLAYGTNFTSISEFVSNTGNNTIDFSADTNFAYVYGSIGDRLLGMNDTLQPRSSSARMMLSIRSDPASRSHVGTK